MHMMKHNSIIGVPWVSLDGESTVTVTVASTGLGEWHPHISFDADLWTAAAILPTNERAEQNDEQSCPRRHEGLPHDRIS